MEIIRHLRVIPDLSIALGFFDGLHLGHKAVIGGAVDFGRTYGYKSAVVTFKDHPYCYLKKISPRYILSQEDKYKKLENIGIDYVIELDFDNVCKMSTTEYLENILVKYFSPKGISSGFNHHFGVNQTGNVQFLSDNQQKYNYTYFATPPATLFGDVISSTAIRRFISEGNFGVANDMLGYRFYVKGKIIEGQKIGRKIGFPTANIEYPKNIIQPAHGVYKTIVELENGDIYNGVANFGLRPTVSKNQESSFEVHLLGFDGNLYGQNAKVTFLKMIRREIKFENLDELKMQIRLDLNEF